MKNKRLTGTLLAILCASIVAGGMVYVKVLSGKELLELFKLYVILVGGVTGAYQGVQSFTDTKKGKANVD